MPWKRYALPHCSPELRSRQRSRRLPVLRCRRARRARRREMAALFPARSPPLAVLLRRIGVSLAGRLREFRSRRWSSVMSSSRRRGRKSRLYARMHHSRPHKSRSASAPFNQQERQQMEALISLSSGKLCVHANSSAEEEYAWEAEADNLGGGHGAGPCGSLPGLGNRMNESSQTKASRNH